MNGYDESKVQHIPCHGHSYQEVKDRLHYLFELCSYL
jgi:hypothetical protein